MITHIFYQKPILIRKNLGCLKRTLVTGKGRKEMLSDAGYYAQTIITGRY